MFVVNCSGTFSKNANLGFIFFTISTAYLINIFLSSFLSCLPAVLIPWQGGVAIIKSTFFSLPSTIIISFIFLSVMSPTIILTSGYKCE